jgi:hypothetical protein
MLHIKKRNFKNAFKRTNRADKFLLDQKTKVWGSQDIKDDLSSGFVEAFFDLDWGAVYKERVSRKGRVKKFVVWMRDDVRRLRGIGPLHTNVGRRPSWTVPNLYFVLR